MINLDGMDLHLPGITASNISLPEAGSKFDLTLYVREQTTGLELKWLYNKDLFNPQTIKVISDRLSVLLDNIINHPEESIDNFLLQAESKLQTRNPSEPTQPHIEFTRKEIFQSIAKRFESQYH